MKQEEDGVCRQPNNYQTSHLGSPDAEDSIMDDLDQYDSASQYGQGFDDTASMISGYTMRTQKTATTGILLEDEVEKLSLADESINFDDSSASKAGEEDAIIELDGKDELPADLPPHACRRVHSRVESASTNILFESNPVLNI